jgi:hypothetical protein
LARFRTIGFLVGTDLDELGRGVANLHVLQTVTASMVLQREQKP